MINVFDDWDYYCVHMKSLTVKAAKGIEKCTVKVVSADTGRTTR